jgi:hypothetical protein
MSIIRLNIEETFSSETSFDFSGLHGVTSQNVDLFII